jgi:hypothetical protein
VHLQLKLRRLEAAQRELELQYVTRVHTGLMGDMARNLSEVGLFSAGSNDKPNTTNSMGDNSSSSSNNNNSNSNSGRIERWVSALAVGTVVCAAAWAAA